MKVNQAPYEKIPYLERRPLGFYLGWHLGIYTRPLYPTGLKPERALLSRSLIASTFNDYYSSATRAGASTGGDRWVPGCGRHCSAACR